MMFDKHGNPIKPRKWWVNVCNNYFNYYFAQNLSINIKNYTVKIILKKERKC